MKKLTKDDLQFLKELANEYATQSNRGTAFPYAIALQEEKMVANFHNEGEHINLYDNDGDCIWDSQYSDESNLESIINWLDLDLTIEELSKEILRVTSNTPNCESVKDWLEEQKEEVNELNYDLEHQYNSNLFFTESGYESHIKQNRHNLSNPRSYGIYLDRNPQMERLLRIIMKFSDLDLKETWLSSYIKAE
jgi:hypothetical protein